LAEAYFFDLDLGKLISMALIHDFGEIYAGDFTPTDEVSPEEKHRLERESIEAVFGKLANGEKYVALWLEFETSDSPEARLIRQLDKLEMALQASLYEHQHNVDLSEFYDSANTAISDEALRKISTSLWDLSAHSD
jgi:putative hydrolase of HD superfamily